MKKIFLLISVLLPLIVVAQVPRPADVFGFEPGADFKLAQYDQMLEFYRQLSRSSPRVELREIGRTVLGKPMIILIISSEDNMNELELYRNISEDLARARVDEETAKRHVQQGKAIVWIDGGLHATEVAGAQMTPELAWRVATEETDEMRNIRENVIMLLMPVMNPDGLDIIAEWYYRNLGTPFETTSPPWLYHHYIGHDNNRDWFMNNMPESYHVNDVIYREWFPQIVYNHHQTSPAWARIFIPPFANPVNPRIHPGATTATNLIGTVMANRFAMKNMPGVVSYQTYSMWWNGGMRTVPYFHNMVGILSETAHATPTPRYYPPENKPANIGGRRGGMSSDGTQIFYPNPWKGGESHFRDAVDYMLTGSMAVLDFAADRRSEYLENIYRMGKDAINGTFLGDNFHYIIPAEQAESREVIDLVNLLLRGGIEIERATRKFRLDGREFAAGSYVISTAQSFRPYLEDLLGEQNYPDQFLYPGGPPTPPYDLAGWTLPLQMGIEVARSSEEPDVRTESVTGLLAVSGGIGKGNEGTYRLPANSNSSYHLVNLLLEKGYSVKRIVNDSNGTGNGDFIVVADDRDLFEEDVNITGALAEPFDPGNAELVEVTRARVGLYKSWVSNMDEGWTRWLLTQYAFEWDTLHNKDVQEGDLSRYDIIIIPDQSASRIFSGHRKGSMPEEFTGGIGPLGVNRLDEYVRAGGRLMTFDGAGDFVIEQLGLPVRNVTSGQSQEHFYVPGSLLRATVSGSEYTWGMPAEVAVSFSNSSAYSIIRNSYDREGGQERSVKRGEEPKVTDLMNYSPGNLLMSGWAMGEDSVLANRSAMLKVDHGDGEVIMIGFRPQFRGQSRATYKLIFNSILKGK